VSGIAVDDDGNFLVVDRLRSAVMVFTPEHRFVEEFGYRGDRPENLIRPGEIAAGDDHRLYVTQMANRGISVFSVSLDGEFAQ
jgi:DNA-binding beta-propeller fold protein YncE